MGSTAAAAVAAVRLRLTASCQGAAGDVEARCHIDTAGPIPPPHTAAVVLVVVAVAAGTCIP